MGTFGGESTERVWEGVPFLAPSVFLPNRSSAMVFTSFIIPLDLNEPKIGGVLGLQSLQGKTQQNMSEQKEEYIESNMKPYMDDYQSTVDGVLQRQKALLAEFSSLTDGLFITNGL